MKRCIGCGRIDDKPLGLNKNGEPFLACCPDSNYVEMTAVEWLASELTEYLQRMYKSTIEQAKEMERKQHQKTWDSALDKYEVRAGNYMRAYEDFDDYYEQFKK